MLQVRLPSSSSNSQSRYRERPGSLSSSKSVTIAPLPTATSAGTYNTSPETSRLIGSSNGNGAACRDDKDLGGAGATVDGEDVNIPPGESPNTYTFTRHAIRSNYMDKSIEAKKKVEKLCFTPSWWLNCDLVFVVFSLYFNPKLLSFSEYPIHFTFLATYYVQFL